MENLYEQIGEKIRDLRIHHNGRGISQEALAEAVRTTANTISRWETATYKPTVSDLDRLALFFGVSIATFFPTMDPNVRLEALFSATRDLDEEDLDEVTRYAQFRKARKELKGQTESLKRRRKT
jgi:transcriptional regulator with XRE-family HTH domain